MSDFDSAIVREYLLELQELIVERLEQVDGKKFLGDDWGKPEAGGRSCILEEGNVLERGGVAFSHMKGDRMPVAATRSPDRRWPNGPVLGDTSGAATQPAPPRPKIAANSANA